MSAATTSQPLVGQSKSAAPFGAVALIAGALTLGAIGIALGQGIKATPAAEAVPADVQAALLTQRMGEKAQLFTARDPRLVVGTTEVQDRVAAAAATDPRLIQHQGELRDKRIAAAFAAGHAGPKTAAQKGLLTPRSATPFPGKTIDDAVSAASNRWEILASNPYAQRMLSHGAVSGAYITSDGRIVDGHDVVTSAPSTPFVPDSRVFPGKVTDDAAGAVLDRWSILAANPYAARMFDRSASSEGKAWATGGRGLSIR